MIENATHEPGRPRIRIATTDDLPALLDLLSQLSQPDTGVSAEPPPDGSYLASVWAEILMDRRRTLLVAEVDDGIVGTADMVVVANLTNGLGRSRSSRTLWSMRSIVAPASGER